MVTPVLDEDELEVPILLIATTVTYMLDPHTSEIGL